VGGYICVRTLLNGIICLIVNDLGGHRETSEKLNVDFFFAPQYHSWERGANENTNGLIRQYFPKKTDFTKITDAQVQWVENILNNRPRKKLKYLSQNEFIYTLRKFAFVT
jgi:transposase, IS30 family